MQARAHSVAEKEGEGGNSFTYGMSEWFFREAGFLLGCAVKPTGYSEMAVQGLASLLEQNLKRQLRIKARRAGNTDKGFEGFCLI